MPLRVMLEATANALTSGFAAVGPTPKPWVNSGSTGEMMPTPSEHKVPGCEEWDRRIEALPGADGWLGIEHGGSLCQ
ncbi:hypothetical protein [Amycolatopsis sp. NPDC059657]|uniref:hypothetical protein n=1 Tax=Amycolatopsis sp. NPDC059657 TaxID=3346899 RepID=UPI0036712ED9